MLVPYVYQYRPDLFKIVYLDQICAEPVRREILSYSDKKLHCNLRRAVRMCEAYALCNEWDYFVTLTIDPKKYDRADLDSYRIDLIQFIRDQRKKWGVSIEYLFVPELHSDGHSWHIHGFIRGLPLCCLSLFTSEFRLPYYILDGIKKGKRLFDWPDYRSRFGFCNLEPIRSRDAAARYITKYMTKQAATSANHIAVGKHLYFVSHGLNLPVPVDDSPLLSCSSSSLCPDNVLPEGYSIDYSFDFEHGSVVWIKKEEFS